MLSIIVAKSINNVIGNNNQLIWHLSEDLKHFKEVTTGYPIIMGRKTYESIGKALPNRLNIVVSNNANYHAEGCVVVSSVQEAIKKGKEENSEKVFIIGGANIYNQTIDLVDEIYITIINKEYEGEAKFPDIDPNIWLEVESKHFERGLVFEHPYSFVKYKRKTL